MNGRKRPSRWAEKTLRTFDWWYNRDFHAVGLFAPRHFWRWKPWQKWLFVIVAAPAVIAVLMLLDG